MAGFMGGQFQYLFQDSRLDSFFLQDWHPTSALFAKLSLALAAVQEISGFSYQHELASFQMLNLAI